MRRALFILVLLVMSTGVGIPDAGAAFPGANGRLVYWMFNGDPQSIHTIDPDGTDDIHVLPDTHEQWEPTWSADGTQIVFLRVGRDRQALVTMASDGSDLQVVANSNVLPRFPTAPAWSPDGTQVAFCALGRDNRFKIFVIGIDGTGLTNVSGAGNDDCRPAWSPDGSTIAFDAGSFSTDTAQIMTMAPDGSNRTVVVGTGSNIFPDWAPDGTALVFMRDAGEQRELFSVPAAGGARTRLTDTPGFEWTPSWAPDGTRIAYCRSRTAFSACDLFTMDPDGTNVVRVTDTPRRDEYYVDWQAVTP